MATIYDLITATNITDFWETGIEQPSLLSDRLFPLEQQLGLKISGLRGRRGIPQVLNPSAYDVAALKIEPMGFELYEQFMPFFKQSDSVSEELRQMLNMIVQGGNQAMIEAVTVKVLSGLSRLLVGARTQRERMALMLLTTGAIAISAKGQNYLYDYELETGQKKEVEKPWSSSDADIISDIESWQNDAEQRSGVRPTRMLINSKTASYFSSNAGLRNAIWGNNASAPILRGQALNYITSATGIITEVYDGQFKDETGATRKYVPDDTVSLFAAGRLGTGRMGTTPEQSDLITSNVANVSITDTGVAVTTTRVYDPVTVDVKVSMIYLPEFDQVDTLIIGDVSKKSV